MILLVSLIGCDNFAAGSLLKEEIQKEIAYAKAQEVNIMVAPSDSAHGTTYPNITKTYKVSDSFSVRFKEAESYYFVKWVAKDVSSDQIVTDIVEFENPEELETTVTVTGNGKDIHICPVVIARPGVTEFYPKNSEKGEPRDSSIVITFDKTISQENDLSAIEITLAGDSVKESFKNPVLNDNIITFAANKDKLIDVESGKTKTVTVKIPSDFYYEENSDKVAIGKDLSFTYKINSTTALKSDITVSTTSEKGTVTPAGTNEYSIGQSFTITFEPAADYNFTGWNILDGEGNEITDSDLYIEDKNALTTTVIVKNDCKGVSITPKSELVPKVNDVLFSDNAKVKVCDTQITVEFNKNIKSEYITYDYIHIQDVFERDISEYYHELIPVYVDEEKLLCSGFVIKLNYSKLDGFRDFIAKSDNQLDVKLIISQTIQDELGLNMESSYTCMFRMNDKIANNPPRIEILSLAKNKEDALNKKNLMVRTAYSESNWSDSDYNKNHSKEIWINCKAAESDKKNKYINIKETLLLDNNGSQINSIIQKQLPYDEDNPIKYVLGSSNDGLIKLDFSITDEVGDTSEIISYYVIKDTQFVQTGIKMYSIGDSTLEHYPELKPSSIKAISDNCRKLLFYKVDKDSWFGNRENTHEEFVYSIHWGPAPDNLTYSSKEILYDENIINEDRVGIGAYSFIFPVDKITQYKDTYYEIRITDDAGNDAIIPGVLWGAPQILQAKIEAEDETNGKVSISLLPTVYSEDRSYFTCYEKISKTNNEIISMHEYSSSSSEFTISRLDTINYKYKFYAYNSLYKWSSNYTYHTYLHGLLSDGVIAEKIEVGTDEQLINPEFTFKIKSAGPSSASYNATFSIDSDVYNKYDKVQAYYKISPSGSDVSVPLGTMTSNEVTYNFDYKEILRYGRHPSGDLYYVTGDSAIKKIGITCTKDRKTYSSEIDCPKLDSFAVDNIPPKCSTNSIKSADSNCIVFTNLIRDPYDILNTDTEKTRYKDSEIAHSQIKRVNGEYDIKCYLVKAKDTWASYKEVESITDLTVEEIRRSTELTAKVYDKADILYAYVPEVLSDGRYVVCLEVEDTAGNIFCGPVSFYKKVSTQFKPSYEVRETGTYINYTFQNYKTLCGTNLYGYMSNVAIQYFDPDANEWKFFESTSGYKQYVSTSEYYTTGTKGDDYQIRVSLGGGATYLVDGKAELFWRVCISESINTGTYPPNYYWSAVDGFYYSRPLYFYNKAGNSSGVMMTNSNGYVPICEQPCLISTVYSSSNLGNNPDVWEQNTTDQQHLKTRQLTNLQSYQPADDVPDNSYYCVIVHFADGTSEMSPVYQK